LISEAEAFNTQQTLLGESPLEYKLTAQYHLTPFNQRLQQTPDYMNPLILERALDHFDLD
jgi:hypothetical protein